MYKQTIILRKDIKMERGKVIAQALHASIGALQLANNQTVERWQKEGGKKIVLKVGSLKELKELYPKAKALKLPCFLVKNAGLTQLKPGTVTALAIGPAKEDYIDKITGKLKLY
ncbi:MAG: peptidyl-tRNA hydrolase Pth2 [Candidatus Aenigmarchaeota archaeon]|nr:peptidyl-tRNA hydrolase Pth2 [Candidatus Aenigmarchaeota archaeon]